MRIDELIGQIFPPNTYNYNEISKYVHHKNIAKENLPEYISNFIIKFKNGQPITKQEFVDFNEFVSQIKNDPLHDALVGIMQTLSKEIYKGYEKAIASYTKKMETDLRTTGAISMVEPRDIQRYMGLINIHLLSTILKEKTRKIVGFTFPGVPLIDQLFEFQARFALNILILTGRIAKTATHGNLTFDRPFYPPQFELPEEERVAEKPGVKKHSEYFPYARKLKQQKGQTGDNTFTATNGKKILYVRGVKRFAAEGILASKIASFISRENFASERMLDNKLIASRELPTYAVALSDGSTRSARKDFIEEQHRVFKGTGTIDEVLNFVGEWDENLENFGFSSRDITNSHLVKIDFDQCVISYPITEKEYEKDILTAPKGGIYHGLEHVHQDTQYIQEKLTARLKLALLPEQLIAAWAEKAFFDEEASLERKNAAIRETINRTNIALELFKKHPAAKAFLKKNPTFLEQMIRDTKAYVATHFDPPEAKAIMSSLNERLAVVAPQLGLKPPVMMPIQSDKSTKEEISPAPKQPIQSKKISEDTFLKIEKEVNNYIKDRSDFFNAFRDPILTNFKKTLANAFLQSIREKRDLVALRHARLGMVIMNDVIEELSDEKHLAYIHNHLNEKQLQHLFNGIISNFSEIVKKSDSAEIAKMLEVNEQYAPLIEAIFDKLQEFHTRELDKGFGKAYRPFFSSGLIKVGNKVAELLDKSEGEDESERESPHFEK